MKIKGKITSKDVSGAELLNHHKVPRVWIVVADQRIARIFKKTNSHLELIGEALPIKKHRAKGMHDDSMGRVTSLHASAHHKLIPPQEPGRQDAMNFAHDLSAWLEEAVQSDLFDRLVLVAAPRTLGDLRPRLHKTVQDRVIAEVNKELTKMNENQLFEELKEIVWF
jgi:protein required for attachment to host cells